MIMMACRSELSVGSNTDGIEVRSVGNSSVLRETALIEAFNLKAAIEYQVKNGTTSSFPVIWHPISDHSFFDKLPGVK